MRAVLNSLRVALCACALVLFAACGGSDDVVSGSDTGSAGTGTDISGGTGTPTGTDTFTPPITGRDTGTVTTPPTDPGTTTPPVNQCKDDDNDGEQGRTAVCPTGTDCNDNNAAVNSAAEDICGDGLDQNCDGDDVPCCLDGDGDGYGEGEQCTGLDCNDFDIDVNPAAIEVCGNGKDDDCDGTDEECPDTAECTEASDTDTDGFGTDPACDPVDCDDADAGIFPGAEEICGDEIDQDCDGLDAECPDTRCEDEDGDGYGLGPDCPNAGDDCNDQDPSVNPAGTEICGDGLDNDCLDGDLECADPCVDRDGDGAPGQSVECATGTDCNDDDSTVHPAATEVCGDSIDNDCIGGDEECPPVPCTTNAECDAGLWCKDGDCVRPSLAEYWAPTIYLDTHLDDPGLDFFTTVDFDGDDISGNNGDNVFTSPKPAIAYWSMVQTESHYYIGYHYYWPRRWSVVPLVGRKYENTMRSVLLVVRDTGPGTMGDLDLMVTTEEDTFHFYGVQGSNLLSNFAVDGTIRWADSGDYSRPMAYILSRDHNIFGNRDWDEAGFPGDNGHIMKWGWNPSTPDDIIGESTYSLISLEDTIWAQREDLGETRVFDPFGRFAGDETASTSLAPWAYRDLAVAVSPRGELLFDPASMVRRYLHFGWGIFHSRYRHNPYAVRVDVLRLQIHGGSDPVGGGDPDPYINLYMSDGSSSPRRVLGASDGSQNQWSGQDRDIGTVFDMATELGRNWFYGMQRAGQSTFWIEVFDDDGFFDDWLMDGEARRGFEFDGTRKLEFGLSDVTVRVVR